MGIRNTCRNESTKLNDPDIPQQSLSAATIWQEYLYSSKILIRRAKEHKIHLKVIYIIKWEKLFYPYYKCLYTMRPKEKTLSNLGFSFSMFGTTLPLLWDQQLRGFRKWAHYFSVWIQYSIHKSCQQAGHTLVYLGSKMFQESYCDGEERSGWSRSIATG